MGPSPGADPATPTPASPAPRGASAADRAAFDQAHARRAGWVRGRFLRRPGVRPDLADDLAQRTWSAVWRAMASGAYDPARAGLGTFVYAVSENIWRQHFKTAQRPGPLPSDALDLIESSSDPDSSPAESSELIDLARTALRGEAPRGAFSDADLQVLRLLARGGSDRALAEQLGIAPSTANARKRAALDRLKDFLTRSPPKTNRRHD